MDTLRVGGSSFVFGEHTNKSFYDSRVWWKYSKAWINSSYSGLYPLSTVQPTLYLLPHHVYCLTYPDFSLSLTHSYPQSSHTPLTLPSSTPNPTTLPYLLFPQPQIKGGNHYLEQSAYLPEHIFISSDSQGKLKNLTKFKFQFFKDFSHFTQLRCKTRLCSLLFYSFSFCNNYSICSIK